MRVSSFVVLVVDALKEDGEDDLRGILKAGRNS